MRSNVDLLVRNPTGKENCVTRSGKICLTFNSCVWETCKWDAGNEVGHAGGGRRWSLGLRTISHATDLFSYFSQK